MSIFLSVRVHFEQISVSARGNDSTQRFKDSTKVFDEIKRMWNLCCTDNIE